jgi:hypothetical protein
LLVAANTTLGHNFGKRKINAYNALECFKGAGRAELKIRKVPVAQGSFASRTNRAAASPQREAALFDFRRRDCR